MSQSINDGGPAFPHLETTSRGEPYHDHLGMSLRDWFAGQAVSGIVGASDGVVKHGFSADQIAVLAYMYADAMLKAREVKP